MSLLLFRVGTIKVAQSVTAWSDTSITFTATDGGVLPIGSDLNLYVETDYGVSENQVVQLAAFTATGVQGTGQVGSVTVAATGDIALTGITGTGQVGSVTVLAEGTASSPVEQTVTSWSDTEIVITTVRDTLPQDTSLNLYVNLIYDGWGQLAYGAGGWDGGTNEITTNSKSVQFSSALVDQTVVLTGVSGTSQLGSVTVLIPDAEFDVTGVVGTGFAGYVLVISNGQDTQTVTAWSDTSITFTVVQGNLPYAKPLNLYVETDALDLLGPETVYLTTATGYGYVDVGTPYATSSYRIASDPADLASGDQIEWSNVQGTGTVTVATDGSWQATDTVTAFDARVWDAGDKSWGLSGEQSIGDTFDGLALLTGVSATTPMGTVSISADCTFTVTGVSTTGYLGSESVVSGNDTSFSVLGVSGTGYLGSTTITNDTVVFLYGNYATGVAATVTLQGNETWTEIDTEDVSDWTDIAA